MELLTVDEVAELLRVSRNKLVLMARRGEIPAISIAGKLRFDAHAPEGQVLE
jgi:excisionase family DNA binding protein